MTFKNLEDASLSWRQACPSGIGWRYLHVAAEGVCANAVVHSSDLFGERHEAYVSITAAVGSMCAYDRSLLTQSRELIREIPGGYYVDVRAGSLSLSGTATHFGAEALAPQEDSILFANSDGASHWIVRAAASRFSGRLTIQGRDIELAGHFYMDEQWGQLAPQDFVQDWVWGHFSSDDFSIAFFHILTQTGEEIRRVRCWSSNGQQRADLASSHLPRLRTHSRLNSVSELCDVTFKVQGEPLNILFALSPENAMRIRQDEEHATFDATYGRWRTTATVDELTKQRRGQMYGICEYLRIRGR